jgi:hypothetical protein
VRRALAAALVLLAAAGGVADARAAGGLAPGAALVVSGTLAPLVTGFGDPVTAQVRVLLDPTHVDPGSLRLRTDFTPWREERQVERRDLEGLVEVTYVLRLTCHAIPCVGQERQWQHTFDDAALRYLERGAERRLSVAWPPLEVSTRLPRGYEPPDDGGAEAPPVWRADVQVPEPSFRAAPRRLQAALVAAGILLIAGSVVLAGVVLRTSRAPKEVPPLERALAMLARARTAAELRAALEAVAVELHPTLAATARELAWSEQAPTEPAARKLSERVREAAP